MGLQVRKRTKGKNGWWNGSYSNKGVGASGSVKVGSNVTYNTGDLINGKTPSRLTVNFGNGIRWVSYGKKKSTRRRSTKQSAYAPPPVGNGISFGAVLVCAVVIGFIVGMFIG